MRASHAERLRGLADDIDAGRVTAVEVQVSTYAVPGGPVGLRTTVTVDYPPDPMLYGFDSAGAGPG